MCLALELGGLMGDREVSRSFFASKVQNEADIQLYKTMRTAYLGLKVGGSGLLLANVWIHLVEPLLALPCT